MKNLLKTLSRSPLAFLFIGVLLGILILFAWTHRQGEKMKIKHLLGIGVAVAALQIAAPKTVMQAAGAQTAFVQDTFGATGGTGNTAGTDLASHTGELGATWTVHPSYGTASLVLTSTHHVRPNATGPNVYLASGTPSTDDQTANFTLTVGASLPSGTTIGVVFRETATGFYFARENSSSANIGIEVYRVATAPSPTYTFLGRFTSAVPAVGAHTVSFHVMDVSGNPTFTYSLDGTATGSTLADTSASKIVTPGKVGLWADVAAADGAGLELSALTFTVPATPNIYPVTNAALYFSPDNSYSDGAGAMQANNVRGSSSFVTWNTPGAYLRTGFTGTSCTVNLSMSALTGATTPAGYYPTVRWSIDGGPSSSIYTLQSTDTALLIATGLAAGTHTLFFQFVGLAGGTSSTPDRYTTPVQAVTITGIAVDNAASVSSYTPKNRVVLTTADSLGEGVRVNGASGLATDQDAFASTGWSLASAMGAEWSSRSIGGGGWTVVGSGNTPPYFTPGNDTLSWWNKYSAGRSLLIAGQLPTIPYVWFNFYGTNDAGQADATVTASVSGWLPAARAAAPGSYIVLGIPPSQYKRNAILAAFTSYQGGSTTTLAAGAATVYRGSVDTRAFLVDLGAAASSGLAQFGTASQVSFDGLHPSAATDALLGAAYTQAIESAITASTIAPGTKRRLL